MKTQILQLRKRNNMTCVVQQGNVIPLKDNIQHNILAIVSRLPDGMARYLLTDKWIDAFVCLVEHGKFDFVSKEGNQLLIKCVDKPISIYIHYNKKPYVTVCITQSDYGPLTYHSKLGEHCSLIEYFFSHSSLICFKHPDMIVLEKFFQMIGGKTDGFKWRDNNIIKVGMDVEYMSAKLELHIQLNTIIGSMTTGSIIDNEYHSYCIFKYIVTYTPDHLSIMKDDSGHLLTAINIMELMFKYRDRFS